MLRPKASSKDPIRPVQHDCPVCHQPQTKIQRKLGNDQLGPSTYVCSRSGVCCLGINLTQVQTWVVV